MKFVDLFAGLGGFHLALKNLGHQCVFACEIDAELAETYQKNFSIQPFGDIRQVKESDIPAHDILCAGFPCQPFSKAKKGQPGLADPKLGDLYLHILRIIHHHRPQFFILENVPNLERHDEGQTWEEIKKLFEAEHYDVRIQKLSPHEFGIPQIRERIYIVGCLNSLNGYNWPPKATTKVSIHSVLDQRPAEARQISEQVRRCLDIWQEFLNRVPRDEKIPHPIWSMEFGATYPYQRTTPWNMLPANLRRYRGSYGNLLSDGITQEQIFKLLPSHARTEEAKFPKWKIRFIHKNREFYERHKDWIDDWMEEIRVFPSSFQKLEWNCQEREARREVRCLDQYVIQIRPSGVRVKRPNTAPSLVAMTATQVPIIAWEGRYMTPTECKRLQSMESINLPDSNSKAYEALGNAVNVRVVSLVAEALVGRALDVEIAVNHKAEVHALR